MYDYELVHGPITNLIKRTLKIKGLDFSFPYPVDIGRYESGRYFVSCEDPKFRVVDRILFEALDRAQIIVEAYHNRKLQEAGEIFDRIHAYHTSGKAQEDAHSLIKTVNDLHSDPPVNITRISVPASNDKFRECRFCGRQKDHLPCMNTRDCEDTTDKICQAALLISGGGEYSWRQKLAHSLLKCKQLPLIHEFKQQIANHDMRFVDLAAKCLRKGATQSMSAVTGNYMLLALQEKLIENLSSVQIAETLDDLIFKALTPLIRNSSYIEYAILELMPHVFLNQRRKFSNKDPESLKDAIFSFVMTNDKEEKIKLLRKQTLERTVYFTILSSFEKDAKEYIENVRLSLKHKHVKTNAKAIKKKYLITSELYETCQSVIYWLNYAYKFRAMIVEKYVRSAYNQSVKMAASTNLMIDQEELFRNLLIVCHKAIDKYDPEKGPLASYIDIWFMEAKTNYKNAHEKGVAMQMSTAQRKSFKNKGNLHTFTVELDDELASSIEDEDYNILGSMIENEEDVLLNNLSCKVDKHKIFCLSTGILYHPTPEDISIQRSSCHV